MSWCSMKGTLRKHAQLDWQTKTEVLLRRRPPPQLPLRRIVHWLMMGPLPQPQQQPLAPPRGAARPRQPPVPLATPLAAPLGSQLLVEV